MEGKYGHPKSVVVVGATGRYGVVST
jgi:hypothetical protein